MTLYSADSFDGRTSTTSLAQTNGAGTLDFLTWTQTTPSTWGTITNQAYTSVSTANDIAWVDIGQADHDVSITYAVVGATSAGLVFRFVDSANHWRFIQTSAGNAQLFLVTTANGAVQQGSNVSGGAAGNVLRAITFGNSIYCYRNNSLIFTAVSTTHNTATKVGMFITSSTAIRLDNFSASSPVVTQTATEVTRGTGTAIGPTLTNLSNGRAGIASGVGTAFSLASAVSFNLPLAEITTATLDAIVSQPTVAAPTPAGQHTNYSLIAVDQTGTRHAEFPQAVISQVTWELNAPGEATFSISIDDPNVEQLPLASGNVSPVREVQIWRNGHLMWWGIPLKRRLNAQTRVWEYSAAGLLWYFTRRYVGDANRGNFLTNPSAETGTSGWSPHNATLSVSTEQHLLRGHSFKVVGGSSNPCYIYSQQLIHGGGIGLALFLSAWCYLDGSTYVAGRQSDMGISCELFRSDPTTLAIKEARPAETPLNDTFPKNRWVRVGTHIWIPPNTTDIITVFLYTPPSTTVYWDALQLVAQDSLAFGGSPPDDGPFDQVTIAKTAVMYAQGKTSFAYDSVGVHNAKSYLNIGTTGALSGVQQQRIYMHSDHQPIYTGGDGSGILDEWPQRVDGFDFDIAVTPDARTFTTYYPKRGTNHTGLALEWGRNIATYDIEEDIGDAANQIVILGDSQGGFDAHDTTREEGGYSNPAALNGLTLEFVESAPTGAPVDTLDHLARVRGAQKESGSTIPSVTTVDGRNEAGDVVLQVIGVLQPGDTVPVRITDGSVQFNETYRVVHLVLDPQTDQMQVGLNKEGVGSPS